ncbi:carbohydrate kinase [Brachybacterium sp. NPDC056505]|uniref:carbohydrate kinase family protein n=1 Tax=Brachybacterium sp. NPDC056505 TaxID=3345843 RepID=UPI00366CB9D0
MNQGDEQGPNASALVIGESLVDAVLDAEGRRSVHPGGSPLNVAVGLGRLGLPTQLATCIGDDRNGDLIRSHLAEAGVAVHPGSSASERTATSRASLDVDGSASYEFDVEWQLEEFWPEDPLLVHTGSLATILEPGASSVESMLSHLSSSVLVTFDPNIRPSLAPSLEAARRQTEGFASLAHVVKMSEEDASWLYPGRSRHAIAEQYASLGVTLFVLTRAERGCSVASGDVFRDIPAEPAGVADTVGAGDAFMSGLIFEIIRSEGIEQLIAHRADREFIETCARTALQSAAITVSRPGANPPSRHELGSV